MMRLFGYELSFTKAAPASARPANLSGVDGHGWWRTILDTFPGSWQQDVVVNQDAVLAQATVFSCITLIASDIAKLRLRVVQRYGRVWLEKTTPGYSDVLNKPNHYQTRQLFVEQWLTSKLSTGNVYVLKERDRRGMVVAMYVLDPSRVTPLVAPDGAVYYQLQEDDLAKITETLPAVPASEIIHDRFNCLFHPLVGLSPIFASGLAATQALQIQSNSAKFFKNQSRPSGILTAPKQISDEAAKRIKDYWEANYKGENKIGSVAVLGDSLTYTPMTVNAVDAQLVEQLKITAEQVCSTFHVPAYMVGVAPPPAQGGVDGEQQRYYAQCLQALIEAAETWLDEGLGMNKPIKDEKGNDQTIGADFELDGLLRMDSRTMAEVEGIKSKAGIVSPDESRQKFNLLPVAGGETPYLQQQNFSLAALAKRDAKEDPFATGAAAAPSPPPTPAPDQSAADKRLDAALLIVKDATAAAESAIERARAETAAVMQQMIGAVDQRMQQMASEASEARTVEAAARAAEVEAAARREADALSRVQAEEQSARDFAALLMAEFSVA